MIDISKCLPISGWMNEPELEWLADTAQKCAVVVEVGSWCGRSSLAIAMHMRHHIQPGSLYCVDAWSGLLNIESGMESINVYREAEQALVEFKKNLAVYIEMGRVIAVREESVEASKTLFYTLGQNSVDWVFLDGDHSYETVSKEIKAYLPLLRTGGLLSGHDLGHGGVNKAVNELVPNHRCITGGTIWYSVKED